MTKADVWREALAAAAGHARVARVLARPIMLRVERAVISGAAISRSELASAGLLSRELDKAEGRLMRLREAARQRGGQ
jgi:hypothetical protein